MDTLQLADFSATLRCFPGGRPRRRSSAQAQGSSTDTPASEGGWKAFNTHPNPFGFTYKKRHGIRVCVTTRSSRKDGQPAGTRAGHPLAPRPGSEPRAGQRSPGARRPPQAGRALHGARPAGKHRPGPAAAPQGGDHPPGPSPAPQAAAAAYRQETLRV